MRTGGGSPDSKKGEENGRRNILAYRAERGGSGTLRRLVWTLNACEADAEDLQAIAIAQGFKTTLFKTAAATREP